MKQFDNRDFQQTLANSVSIVGIGLHSGRKARMNIRPAHANSGIIFCRKDKSGRTNRIAARWPYVSDTRLSTTLKNDFGVKVQTVEHLLAALKGCGIDNAVIEIDGPEVPIMDGSAAPFVEVIQCAGKLIQKKARRNYIKITRPIKLRLGDSVGLLFPSKTPTITVNIDFPNTTIGYQTLSLELGMSTIQAELASARTFGFANQIQFLKSEGFALGGSLNNAILIHGNRIINEDGLRYNDEFVRHKMLDCLGDLSLAGLPIIGHYLAVKPSHTLNTRIVEQLFKQRSHWIYNQYDEKRSELAGSYPGDTPAMGHRPKIIETNKIQQFS